MMKTTFVYVLTMLIFVCSASCEKEKNNTSCNTDYSEHPKNGAYQTILQKYVDKGLTGLAVTVHTPKGIWTGASGFANVEEQLDLTPCNPQYSASIQKTLIAVVTLQLIQEGKLRFDSMIEPFLSERMKDCLPNYDQISIKQLLMHTSGLHDVFEENFINDFFANPMASYTSEDFLEYVKEAGPVDLPGVQHYYSDANYILLSIVIDSITGSHIKAIENRILNPVHMKSSTYHNKDYPHPEGLVNSYWNSPIDGSFENISEIQNHLTQQIYGSDGLITTTTDLDLFINALFKGNLIPADMKELLMTEKVKNENEMWMNDYYGYGVMFIPDEEHGEWIGHSGIHIGAAAFTYYNPRYDVSISAMTNSGTLFSEEYMVMFYYELFADLIELAIE